MPDINVRDVHMPVLAGELVNVIEPLDSLLVVDATVGLGGHSELILASSTAAVIGLDQDAAALELARGRLAVYGERFLAAKANFADLGEVLAKMARGSPDRIVADLGVSSLQLDSQTRGFSFRFDAPLDMRMDGESTRPTAADLLATLDHEDLANIIYRYGEERHSRRIAKWIIEKRDAGDPIRTTTELAELVTRAVPKSSDRIHPATRTFQALRIAVNDELAILEGFIDDAVRLLNANGILAIITFHSLEDRIVKHAFRRLSGKCECPPRIPECVCGAKKQVEIITRRPIVPTAEEERRNPRSRSAKLRAARKL
ncbi:MAG: 16S rRNA (cytosine(1402)-N(4))-methyltransferase RsmH [Pyrinomonadaceae bacterium]